MKKFSDKLCPICEQEKPLILDQSKVFSTCAECAVPLKNARMKYALRAIGQQVNGRRNNSEKVSGYHQADVRCGD